MVSLHRTNYSQVYRTYFQIHRIVLVFAISFGFSQLPLALAQPATEEDDDTTARIGILFGCTSRPDIPGPSVNPLDPIEMNSVIIPFERTLVKTVHVEKEVFICQQEAPPYRVIVDVSIYAEILEDANTQEPLQKNFEVITCMKYFNGTVLGCMSEQPPTDVPALPCEVEPAPRPEFLRFPIEMNSVAVANGTIVKTIMAETEVFSCPDPYSPSHRISKEVTLFTEKFEIISSAEPQPTISKRNHFETAECVKNEIFAEVVGCTFRPIG